MRRSGSTGPQGRCSSPSPSPGQVLARRASCRRRGERGSTSTESASATHDTSPKRGPACRTGRASSTSEPPSKRRPPSSVLQMLGTLAQRRVRSRPEPPSFLRARAKRRSCVQANSTTGYTSALCRRGDGLTRGGHDAADLVQLVAEEVEPHRVQLRLPRIHVHGAAAHVRKVPGPSSSPVFGVPARLQRTRPRRRTPAMPAASRAWHVSELAAPPAKDKRRRARSTLTGGSVRSERSRACHHDHLTADRPARARPPCVAPPGGRISQASARMGRSARSGKRSTLAPRPDRPTSCARTPRPHPRPPPPQAWSAAYARIARRP